MAFDLSSLFLGNGFSLGVNQPVNDLLEYHKGLVTKTVIVLRYILINIGTVMSRFCALYYWKKGAPNSNTPLNEDYGII